MTIEIFVVFSPIFHRLKMFSVFQTCLALVNVFLFCFCFFKYPKEFLNDTFSVNKKNQKSTTAAYSIQIDRSIDRQLSSSLTASLTLNSETFFCLFSATSILTDIYRVKVGYHPYSVMLNSNHVLRKKFFEEKKI